MKTMAFPLLARYLTVITIGMGLGLGGAQGATTNDFLVFDYDVKNDHLPAGRGELPGRLYVPTNTATPRPLVIFYCGSGELMQGPNGGITNYDEQVTNPSIDKLLAKAKSSNFFLYAPQGDSWNYADIEQSMVMAQVAMRTYNIDPAKISVTGLSQGGTGARTAISHFTDILAAAVPICSESGEGEAGFYADLANKPAWLFHGTGDPSNSVVGSRNFINGVRTNAGLLPVTQWPVNAPATNRFYNDGLPYYTNYSAYNGAAYLSAGSVPNFADSPELRYTEFNTNTHGIWTRVYTDNETNKSATNAGALYTWWLSRSLPAGLPAALKTNQTLLYDFGVTRLDPGKDSLGRYWNGAVYGQEQTTNFATIPYAVTTTGKRTSVKMEILNKFGNWHKRGIITGAPYGDSVVTWDGWESVVNATPTSNYGAIRFRGLQPASSYQFKIWASDTNSDGTYGRKTRYEVSAATPGTTNLADLTVAYNTNTFQTLSALADANGVVDLKVYPQPGTTSRYGEISTLEITPVAAGPVAVNDTTTTPENTVVDINVLANDTGATVIQSSFPVPPGHGTVSVVNVGGVNKVHYTPATAYNGADSFSYTIINGTATATASVAVTVTNVPPTAVADSATLNEGVVTDIDVLANDSGPNPLTIQPSFSVPPLHGTVAVVAGKVQYTPTPGYYGSDNFIYTADDGGDTATAMVTLTINSTAIANDLTADGLTGTNIGSGSAGSSRVLLNSDWEINGSGTGIGASSDSFHLESADITGNFRMVAQVKSLVSGGTLARAGLMLREGTSTGARMVYVGASTGPAYNYGIRTTVGGATAETTPSGSYTAPNAWVKLERVGNTVILSTSPDGVTYSEVNTTTLSSLAATVQAGVFSSSGTSGTNARAVLAGFLLTETNVVFQQTFQGSTVVTDYFNAASPNERKFNDIGGDANGGTWTINGSGQLQLTRVAGASPDNGAGFCRYTNLAATPAVLVVRFNFGVSGLTTGGSQNDLMSLDIGNFTAFSDYNNGPAGSALFGRFNIDGGGSGNYKFEMNGTLSAAYSANGTMHAVNYFLNKSGSTASYTDPNGTSQSLAANCASLWVDGTLLFNGMAASNGATSALTDLRVRFPFVDNGVWKFSNFVVETAF